MYNETIIGLFALLDFATIIGFNLRTKVSAQT